MYFDYLYYQNCQGRQDCTITTQPNPMKNILLLTLTCLIGFAAMAQRPLVNKNIYTRNCQKEQVVTREPVEKVSVSPVVSRHRGLKSDDNSNIVTVLDLGTSANVLGYSGGTRTMLWADDDLNVVANFRPEFRQPGSERLWRL